MRSSISFEDHDPLPGAHGRSGLHAHFTDGASQGCQQRYFHLHRLQNYQYIAGFNALADFDLYLPKVTSDVAVDAVFAGFKWSVFSGGGNPFIAFEIGLAAGYPAFAFGVERALLLGAERRDASASRVRNLGNPPNSRSCVRYSVSSDPKENPGGYAAVLQR